MRQHRIATKVWALGLAASAMACGGADDGPSGQGSGASAGVGASAGSGANTGAGGAGGAGAGGGGGHGGSGGSTPLPCGSVPTFEEGLSPSVEIHVADDGSDGSGDGSAGSPYATIGRAVQDAVPGAAVVVHAGTYAGGVDVTDVSGTADAPIWIGGAAGESRPLLVGGPNGLRLSRVRHLVVHDLEIEAADFNGINADDGSVYDDPEVTRHIVFRGLDIHDIGGTGNQDCLKLSGLDDFFVLDSSFARCGGGSSGSGIDHVGCHHGAIVGNLFDTMSGNGVQCKGGSEDIEIRRNRFVDAGHRAVNMGGSTGFEHFRPPLDPSQPNAEARDIRVVANVIEGAQAALGFVGCVGCVAANNTIVDPEHWVLRILQETTTNGGYQFLPSSNGVVVNNLVYFDTGLVTTHVNVGTDTDPASFQFVSNAWYAHDVPAQSQPNLPVAEQGGIVGTPPGMIDPAGGSYMLGTDSSLVGAGTDVEGLGSDYDGACFASPPSVGAFEGGAR